ncbi:MAG: nicotinate-nucleotide adenylyltransferase [Pseudomonadales bacterium]|nr:nicotinate-nucleotide adenylyltransferase [Pseudomonadales bacterium]
MIGYYGGGFDPIHNGHIHAARAVLDSFALTELRFVLTARPVHKNISGRSISQRWAMLELALDEQAQMQADDIEIADSETRSFSFNTLSKLRHLHGPSLPLFWIIGYDQFAVLNDWYRGIELISLAHILVLSRPGPCVVNNQMQGFTDLHGTDKKQELLSSPAGKLYFVSASMLDISSTKIRKRLQAGLSVEDMIPARVWSYIMDNKLYLTGDSE